MPDDRYDGRANVEYGPPVHAAEITPSDTEPLPFVTTAIHVGQGGTLKVTLKSGAVVTYHNLQDGSLKVMRVTHVHATGTSATYLVAET